MPITYQKDLTVFTGVVSVEDAEPLLEALQKMTVPVIDLAGCTHFHPANIQVVLASGALVQSWPSDPGLAMWLQSVLAV